jgi:hypothetical protein
VGLFEKIFKPKDAAQAEVATTYFRTLTAYTPVFTTWRGSIYEMELTRAAIHAIATHCSKLKPEVEGAAKSGLKSKLQVAPNDFQNTAQFLYRLATVLYMDTTAFIVPITPDGGPLTGWYPLLPSRTELAEYGGQMWLRYTFSNGQKAAVEFSRVGILTRFQYLDDFFGSGNLALAPTLNLLEIQREGMEEAIKAAATIRFIGRLAQSLRPEDIKKERDRFAADNLSSDNKTGLMLTDSKYAEIKQIESKPWLIDDKQMALIKDNVFGYFGVNDKILKNEFDEAGWNAFYEGVVEPFALQLSLEMTRMTFTAREQALNNGITLSSNRLQYASIASKTSVVEKMVDRGLMSNWAAAEVMNLPKPPGEERWVIRGEYIDVNNLPANTLENARTYLQPTPAPAPAEPAE